MATLLAAMALLACEKTSWNEVARLPRGFRCGAVVALTSNEGLVGGRVLVTQDNRLATKEGLIFRVRGTNAEQVFARPNADVFSLSSCADTHWALVRLWDEEGEAVTGAALLASTDGGKEWNEIGPVPEHATSLLATSPSRLWVLGVDLLLHSADGGRSWMPVEAPGERNPIEERIVVVDEDHVGIIGDGVLLLDRKSARYERHVLRGVRLRAADGRYVVAEDAHRQRIGMLDEELEHVEWLGSINEHVAPFDLAASEKAMSLLALPGHDPLPLRGVHLFTSTDGGRSWSGSRVRSAAWYDDVDVGPGGAGIGVGYENEVWLAGP